MLILFAINPLFILTGFVIGFIVGLTGVGGGSLMTPALILLFGIHPATAVGTDLLFAAITKSAGTLINGFNHAVDWRIVLRLAAGSVPAATITLIVLSHIGPQGTITGHLVSMLLGTMLVLTAITLFLRKQVLAYANRHTAVTPRQQMALTIISGAILGVLVSISSVGAGAIGVAALMLLYPRLPTLKIIGSDIAHAVPLTLVAGLGHLAIGDVEGAMLVSLLIGSIPGILISSTMAPRLPEAVLRYVLAAVLALVGLRLIAP